MRTVELEPHSAGRTLGMVDVMSNLQIQQLSTTLRKLFIHRTLEKMRAKYCREVGDSYTLLPQFCRSYSDLNPKVVVALQVDHQDCFMRLVVSIPHFQEVFSKPCLRMLHINGAHLKCTLYDGGLILIVAKLGNGSSHWTRSCPCPKWSTHGLDTSTVESWWIGCVIRPNFL
jgi:hypothetical protein